MKESQTILSVFGRIMAQTNSHSERGRTEPELYALLQDIQMLKETAVFSVMCAVAIELGATPQFEPLFCQRAVNSALIDDRTYAMFYMVKIFLNNFSRHLGTWLHDM